MGWWWTNQQVDGWLCGGIKCVFVQKIIWAGEAKELKSEVIILKQAGSNSVNVFIQSQHTVYEEFNMKNWKDKLKLK